MELKRKSNMGYGKMKYKKGGAMKAVPKDNKGLAKLPTAVRNKMGYMKMGGEKLLTKMTYGGSSMDMSDTIVNKIKMGGERIKKYKMGGWTSSDKKGS